MEGFNSINGDIVKIAVFSGFRICYGPGRFDGVAVILYFHSSLLYIILGYARVNDCPAVLESPSGTTNRGKASVKMSDYQTDQIPCFIKGTL